MNIKKIIIPVFLILSFAVFGYCGVSRIPGLFPQIGGIPGIQIYRKTTTNTPSILLLETGDNLLLETGDNFLLE